MFLLDFDDMCSINPMSTHIDNNAVLARFSVLMDELLRSGFQRGKFERWEIDLLLDIECCQLNDIAKRKALYGYEDAVQWDLENGASTPMRFSAYLQGRDELTLVRRPAGAAKRKIVAN
jgi:hypothetical protein